MTDSRRPCLRTRLARALLPLLAGGLLLSSAAAAQNIPVRFYISPNDDGGGGHTIHLTGTFSLAPPGDPFPLVFAVWADPGMAASGQGLFSVQDVRIARAEEWTFFYGVTPALQAFTCDAPGCLVGPRPDPEIDVLFAAGDDTSATPTLTAPFRVGYLTVFGFEQGTVSLVAGTALDANGVGGPLDVGALPNQGTLIRFLSVPEPATGLQVLVGVVALCALGRGRRGRGPGQAAA